MLADAWRGGICQLVWTGRRLAGTIAEEGITTTPLDMTVLNDLDRFHLVMDTIDRLAQTGQEGVCLKQQLEDRLIGHKQYLRKNGQDLSEVRKWRWNGAISGTTREPS